MTESVATVVVGSLVGGGLVTGAAQLVGVLTGRGKNRAETDSLVVESAERVVAILRKELDEAREEAASCRADISTALERASRAEERAQELDHELGNAKRTIRDLRRRVDAVERRTG